MHYKCQERQLSDGHTQKDSSGLSALKRNGLLRTVTERIQLGRLREEGTEGSGDDSDTEQRAGTIRIVCAPEFGKTFFQISAQKADAAV